MKYVIQDTLESDNECGTFFYHTNNS